MKIAINGSLGSGKSTVAKLLAERLGYEYMSTGKIFRDLAKERNMDVLAFSKLAEKDRSIDDQIDGELKALNDEKRNIVIDSRMAPIFVPEAVKIRLIVSDEEGARRIFKDKARGEVECFQSEEDAQEGFRIRANSERERYYKLYGVDLEDHSLYDLVIDTSALSVDEVIVAIENYLQK